MGVLTDQQVQFVHHYAPLHYLVFIARSRALLSKPSLKKVGFNSGHLRSMSKGQDVARGFGNYTHLTLDAQPRILKAKLAAGFPHFAIGVPVNAVEAVPYSLCRFNVAMTRKLKRDGKRGFPESATNGRYYPGHQIPIARSDADKTTMMQAHLDAGTMIEVLVHGDIALPDDTSLTCYAEQDLEIAKDVLKALQCPWELTQGEPPGAYPRCEEYVKSVTDFIGQALADPTWRGNGLEFDRLKPK